MKRPAIYSLLSATLCLTLALGACSARDSTQSERASYPSDSTEAVGEQEEAELPEADFSLRAITAHVELPVTTKLAIVLPVEDTTTTAENYYITGTSDPAQELLLDGEQVEDVGSLGSFGVFAPLELGENEFVFTQGGESATVTITRIESWETATTSTLTRIKPDTDIAVREGTALTLSCTAPAGATVTAQVGDDTVSLVQSSPTDMEGVPVTFTGGFDPGAVSGTVSLGKVTYTLQWNGETKEFTSAGTVFCVGQADPLLVRAISVSSPTFVEDWDDSGYHSTLKEGAVSVVEEIGGDMYRLANGGWVFPKELEHLTDEVPYINQFTDCDFVINSDEEILTLRGKAAVPFVEKWTGEELVLTFSPVTESVAFDLEGSAIFDGGSVSLAGDDAMALTFTLLSPDSLWGYQVEYKGADTVITFQPKPTLQDSNRPLAGISIIVDPGHGGDDPGAAGVAVDSGPWEKEINLATAQAVEKFLRGLGANVIMTRDDDTGSSLDERLAFFRGELPALVLSIHSNSIDTIYDGTGASGVEVYYYEESHHGLAETLVNSICERTGRKNRGAKRDYYRITLGSYAPVALIEMGFITNPVEYDDLRTNEGIYDMAAAIADGVLELLGDTQDTTAPDDDLAEEPVAE